MAEGMVTTTRAEVRASIIAELRSIAEQHWLRLEAERRQHHPSELFAQEAAAILARLDEAGIVLDDVERKHLAWLANGENETFAVVISMILDGRAS